jgi:hypothetical protein
MRHPMFLNHAEVNGLHQNIRIKTIRKISAYRNSNDILAAIFEIWSHPNEHNHSELSILLGHKYYCLPKNVVVL